MSPSILRVLFIALLVCTLVADAIKCYSGGEGINKAPKDCESQHTFCGRMGDLYSCVGEGACAASYTCCKTDLCTPPEKKEDPTTPAPAKGGSSGGGGAPRGSSSALGTTALCSFFIYMIISSIPTRV